MLLDIIAYHIILMYYHNHKHWIVAKVLRLLHFVIYLAAKESDILKHSQKIAYFRVAK